MLDVVSSCRRWTGVRPTERVLPELTLEGREVCHIGPLLLLLVLVPLLEHYRVQQRREGKLLLPFQSLAKGAVTIVPSRSQVAILVHKGDMCGFTSARSSRELPSLAQT